MIKINQFQAKLGLVFTIYPDKKGEWRWRLSSIGNGRILADSGEGYKRKAAAIRAARNLRGRMSISHVVVVDKRTGRKVNLNLHDAA